jgi:hypothetical protein
MVRILFTSVAFAGLLPCAMCLSAAPETKQGQPAGNVIRPQKVPAKVPGCKISKPGKYKASPGDLIELEYTFPVTPDAVPHDVGRETDRGAIYPSNLGIRRLVVPDMLGTGTYLFYFEARHEGRGAAFVVIDRVKYEYVFEVAKDPSAKSVRRPHGLPVGLCAVQEMKFIPEVGSWNKCAPGAYPEAVKQVQNAWPEQSARIARYVTPDLARRLSLWAQKEMEAYQRVPPLDNIRFTPVTESPKSGWIVLRGIVDTLPTHAPGVVTRWLELYVLCDKSGKPIERVTVTIRGERQE